MEAKRIGVEDGGMRRGVGKKRSGKGEGNLTHSSFANLRAHTLAFVVYGVNCIR